MKLASTVTLDWSKGITIDGIEFPLLVSEDVEIVPGGHDGMTTVVLPLYVDGVVIMTDRRGERRVVDSEFGDVGEWARNLVRAGLLEAHPWLTIEEAA